MKNFLKITLCVFLLLGFLSCKQSVLNVYNWDNYMDPELIEKFEKKFNCKVEMDYYHTNEAAFNTMLDTSRTKKYDILIISLLSARNLYEQRVLSQFDLEKIPNTKNITRMFVKKSIDGVMRYSIPYLITYSGIAYNKNMVNNFEPTWKMFSREDLAGKVGVLDDMRETVGIAIKASGYSYNSSGEVVMKQAEAALMRVKRNMPRISYFKELEAELRSGDLYLIMDYGGDAVKLIKENSNIGFVIPEEGTLIVTDSFTIPREAQNVDDAYEFINFFLEPDISAANMEYTQCSSPNVPARKLLKEEFRNNTLINPPQGITLKSDFVLDLEDTTKHEELWRMMKR